MQLKINDARITSRGYFVGRAVVGGVGVQDYSKEYGFKALRTAGELGKKTTLDSIKAIPISYYHPAKDLNSDNTLSHTIGWTGGDVQFNDGELSVDFKVVDKGAVQDMVSHLKDGKNIQWSLGLQALPVKKQGTWQDGQDYQVVFEEMEHDHLAMLLGDDGRYPHTRIIKDSKKDSKVLFFIDGVQKNPIKETNTVEITLPSGAKIEVEDSQASYLQNHLKDHDDIKSELSETKGSLKAAQKQIKDAKSQILDSKSQKEATRKHVQLVLEAQKFLDSADTAELAGMSDRELYEAVLIEDGCTAEELKNEDDGVIRGMYRQFKKGAGESESQQILDTAGKAKEKKQKSNPLKVEDAFSKAKSKMYERMDGKSSGKVLITGSEARVQHAN